MDEATDRDDDAEPLRRGRSPLFRIVALLLLIAFVLVWIPGIIDAMRVFFEIARP